MNNKAIRLALFVLLQTLFSMELSANEPNNDMFEKIFQYELNNRAFAFISATQFAEKKAGTEEADFWAAYVELENINRPLYTAMAKKYGLEVNSLLVKMKVWGTNLAFKLFSEKMLKIMADATADYVDKLKPLPDLAREEDKVFFEYVIAQERAQAVALAHALDKRYELAASSIRDFLLSQNK
jgi:hypothetical protein